MTNKPRRSLLLRVEYLIIAIFFLSFILFSMSRCNKTRQTYEQKALADNPPPRDTSTMAVKKAPAPARDTVLKTPASTPAAPSGATILYVTIEGLKVRSKPELGAGVLGSLKLYDEVYYMNEVTKETTELSLGAEKANEPWVKIKTRKGTIGWVYGAGVSYYKTKRKGAF